MKKQITAILLLMSMIFGFSVYAEDEEYEKRGDFLYYPNTNKIYLYDGDSADVVIPSGTDITKMQAGRLKHYNSLTISEDVVFDSMPVRADKLILADGITDIPDGVFGQISVKEIVFPNSLKTIGSGAFERADMPDKITLPDSLTSIGDKAFYQVEGLQEVEMGDNVTSIGDKAFSDCHSLRKVHLSERLTDLGNSVFAYTELKELNFPNSMLTHINAGSLSIKNLSECSIKLDTKMTVELYDYLGKFSDWKQYCDKYTDNGNWYIIDGTLVAYEGNSSKPEIPASVTEIHKQAFAQLPTAHMETIIIPSSVKKINANAFSANFIDYIVIPDTVEEIGESFLANTMIKELTIEGTPKISADALRGCQFLLKSKIHVNPNCKLPSDFYSEDLPETEWWLTDPAYKEMMTTPAPTSSPNTDETPAPTAAPEETPAPSAEPKTLYIKGGETITIKVDAKTVDFPDAKPFVDDNGRTQVPVRAVSELLDCKVDWVQETQTAVIEKENGEVITLTLGSNVMMIGKKEIKMDTTVILKEERTYIPVRFVAEALGLTVEWVE
ncbi:MAG: leucine-rich repeat protein [Oscillospiraceae bacterium]|nr:leucine-rich repeat protein [Oscillospiraceae bacterium]